MALDPAGLRSHWRRTYVLAWPIAVQQFLGTLMRTVDVLVTGLFSPAAVAAVGLADLYADLPRRVGAGLGTGAITLASQDTGRGAAASRDVAISQALVIGFVAGLPFALVGLAGAQAAIAVLGASSEVVRLGGTYLSIVFAVAPLRIVAYTGAAALQGTGDTRTPMLVNGAGNLLNIAGTVGLGLGLGPLPQLGIVGVAASTAGSRVFEAAAVLLALRSDRTPPTLVRPRNLTVTRQLLALAVPRFGEQLSTSVASFPFNALLLTFGTEVNAAYHIGRRLSQQIAAPFYRTFGTAAAITVGQRLGEGRPDEARDAGYAIALLGGWTTGLLTIALFLAAPWLAAVFTDDAATVGFAVAFTRVFAATFLFRSLFFVFAGALRSAGDARSPFYVQVTGQFGVTLGFSALASLVLGYGVVGVYAGLLLTFVWMSGLLAVRFARGGWVETAAALIEERSRAVD